MPTPSKCSLLRLPLTALLAALLGLAGCSSRPGRGDAAGSTSGGCAILSLSDSVHSFGTIRAGEVVECSFTLRNEGEMPLRLDVMPPDCRCLTVRPMEAEIAPRGLVRLRVAFDSRGFSGAEMKRVELRTNGTPSRVNLLLISNIE